MASYPNTSLPQSWSPRTKCIASILLAGHLLIVFGAPAASPQPSSDSWAWFAGRVVTDDGIRDGVVMPYLRAGYLNHGYRFFAPNPGPSHLVRYEMELISGGTIQGRFPDPDEQWPRLLYHRMFMISETVFNVEGPVSEPLPADVQLSKAERIDFDKQRACADALLKSIANRLLEEYDGKHVKLFMQTHEIPFPRDVAAGQKLDDPRLYHERLLGEYGTSTEERI